ncbi:MAG: cation:proton antiporter [Bacteroidales bacterium]|nr:cation:proton antiporter [Bacteroidales bacterium]
MEINILKDIIIIFALSTAVNFLFTRIKIPTIIGYMLTGIVAGPHLLAVIKQPHEIELMAEIGVILLLFTIGMEFSLNHLLKIRKIVFLGGFMQFILTTVAAMFAARLFGANETEALFIGFLTALSSTAVVLKLLQERSELSSNYGRTVLGILIFQDILLAPLLLLTPMLGGELSGQGSQLALLLVKAIIIIVIVYAGNRWLMPWFLHLIALTKNQELFLMCILLICLSVAMLTSELGLSLAFGAFLAGLMISESGYSHNAFGHLVPFKDTFTSFFFVSIGMMLDLQFVLQNPLLVLGTVAMVIMMKTIIAGGTAFVLGHTFRGTVMVGIALSQVGEFSFLLAKKGLDYHIMSDYYFHLFLAVAVITVSVSPILIHVSRPLANVLLKLPVPKRIVEGIFPLQQIDLPELKNHIVFIGKDSRSLNLSKMARFMNLPYIAIAFDPATARQRQRKGDTIIYGDAVNEPILLKAHTDTAEIIVVSVGNLITAMSIVEKIRNLNKHGYIFVRTKYVDDIEELYRIGADQVIPEEFETAIEIFERILKKMLVPQRDINIALAKIREENYGIFREEKDKKGISVLNELPNIEITAFKVVESSPLVGKNLIEMQFRKKYRVTLIAILRNGILLEHPDPGVIFYAGDIIYIMGKPDQIADAVERMSGKES